MSEPIVCTSQWRQVMQSAGYRCQCTGACGSRHTKGEGRCPREHDEYADKGLQRIWLAVAPADPALSDAVAADTPLDQLRAWCGPCRDAVRRTARRNRSEPNPDQGALFSL